MYVQEFCLTAETEQLCPLVLLEAGVIQVRQSWGISVERGDLAKKPAQKRARCEKERKTRPSNLI